MDQRVVAIDRRGAGAYSRHDSYKKSGTDGTGDGAEGGQERRCIGHLSNGYAAGPPSKQRHHQASDGNISDYVKDGCRPQRCAGSEEEHSEIAHNQYCRACHKQLFNAHFIIQSSGKGTDNGSSQRSGKGYQTRGYC